MRSSRWKKISIAARKSAVIFAKPEDPLHFAWVPPGVGYSETEVQLSTSPSNPSRLALFGARNSANGSLSLSPKPLLQLGRYYFLALFEFLTPRIVKETYWYGIIAKIWCYKSYFLNFFFSVDSLIVDFKGEIFKREYLATYWVFADFQCSFAIFFCCTQDSPA